MIAVAAADETLDSTPVVWGQSEAEAGTVVTLDVTDSAGETQTFTTEINENGRFSVSVPEKLAVGGFTVTASITDEEGNVFESMDKGGIVSTDSSVYEYASTDVVSTNSAIDDLTTEV